uniref:Uncharacterized protein n=1 Tax=Glossina brevipalpis TaxID=37001 RepID=A0A1A9W9K5_9MUSC
MNSKQHFRVCKQYDGIEALAKNYRTEMSIALYCSCFVSKPAFTGSMTRIIRKFPAMRRLSIATAHAFMLVYAITSGQSFQCVKQCFEEIREQRADFQDIPIVIAGNKSDLAKTHQEVKLEEVTDWVYCELPRLRLSEAEDTSTCSQN